MSDNTLIEWADATVNAVNGCSVLSPGCTNCYAMKLAGTRLKHHPSRAGLTVDTKAGPVWNGTVRLNEQALMQPLRWKRPRRIFWNAHGDLFHHAVPDEWIDRVFAVCALTPQHTHMILTKRTGRMRDYVSHWRATGRIARVILDWLLDKIIAFREPWPVRSIGDIDEPIDLALTAWPLPNVWLGTSVEDQTRADERIPHLLDTPAAVRFISAEPLLGPVDLDCPSIDWSQYPAGNGLEAMPPAGKGRLLIDWVIVGGESGPRPMHPAWARSLRDQCAEGGVPFFFKQWGEFGPYNMEPGVAGFWFDPDGHVYQGPTKWPPDQDESRAYMIRWGKKRAGRLLDGRLHSAFPA